ncbi:hypothetical protein GPECTOR_6g648 [Gonium pectorale]|uniref:Uncharacterized protein n=1 Tax=Gonium pectorale TaxID=33097 RepID=A0A150GV72_GONPE|nr:hypothetical protein GPECTOR_6g648 [Gonium pectorale]|eukprot:KXZ53731.1 hypothetical protein GPECTOR_6g648 [Gonium pectorale]
MLYTQSACCEGSCAPWTLEGARMCYELGPKWGIKTVLIKAGGVKTPIWDKSLANSGSQIQALDQAAVEPYRGMIEEIADVSRRAEEGGITAEEVAATIEEALTSPNPRSRYLIGNGAERDMTARRLLPDWLWDRLLLGQLQKTNEPWQHIESPFIHIDTVGGDGEGEGGSGSGAGEGGRRADAEGGDAGEEEEGADGGRGGRKKRRGGQEPEQRQSQEEGDAGDLGVQEGEGEDGDEDGGGDGRRRKSAGAAGLGPGSARAAQAAAAAREAARRRRAHAAAMQGRFRHEASDALRHFLHARNLREAADLHRQLLRVLALQQAGAALGPAATAGGGAAAAGGTLAEELAAAAREIVAAMAVPTATAAAAAVGSAGRGAAAAAATAAAAALSGPAASAAAGVAALLPERVAAVLRRALAAGWADQVARRMRSAEYLAQLGESRRKRHAVRYQPACVGVGADAGGGDEGGGDDAAVFLHPRSALHAAAPELLVYCSLLRTDKRPYMVGLTSIEAEWLAESGTPLCVLSAGVLPDPAPAYKGPPVDGVVAWREAAYGLHAWPLPPVAAPHPDAAERAAVFGAALLEGRVLPGLAELRPLLAASPAMMLRPELRGVARVGELVGALSRRRIDSRRSLAAAWAADPTALQRELAAWVSKHQQALLLRLWPRLLQEAAAPAAAGAERKQQIQQRKERGREGKAAAPAASGGKNAKKKAGKA